MISLEHLFLLLCFVISQISLVLGMLNRSWRYLLVSILFTLPFSWHFAGAEHILKFLMFLPVIPASMFLYLFTKKGQHTEG